MTSSNTFYQWPAAARRRFQVKLALYAVGLNVLVTAGLWLLSPSLLVISALFVAVTLSVIASFFDVPGMVEKGMLTYYSSFLLGEKPKDGRMTVHGGTLFDYYFTLDRGLSGTARTRQVLAGYLRGLLALTEAHDDELTIRGTSYIVGERTANRVGLKKVPTDTVQYLILLFNYVNLTVAMRLVKGRWELPKFRRIHTFAGRVGDVRLRAAYIETLLERLEAQD